MKVIDMENEHCSVVDCEEAAEFLDPMDNPVCCDHMEQDIEEGTFGREEFEQLASESEQKEG